MRIKRRASCTSSDLTQVTNYTAIPAVVSVAEQGKTLKGRPNTTFDAWRPCMPERGVVREREVPPCLNLDTQTFNRRDNDDVYCLCIGSLSSR